MGGAVSDIAKPFTNLIQDTGGNLGNLVKDTGGNIGNVIGGPVGTLVKDTTGNIGNLVKDTTSSDLGKAAILGGAAYLAAPYVLGSGTAGTTAAGTAGTSGVIPAGASAGGTALATGGTGAAYGGGVAGATSTGSLLPGALASSSFSGLGTGATTMAASDIFSKLGEYGSSVLDFGKANPQLAGSLLGALTAGVSAANAPTSQTTTTSIDPQIKAEYLANLERAKTTAAGLGSRQFAGFTGDYGLAESQLKNLGLGGKGQQTTDEAARRAMIEAGFTPQQIAASQAQRSAVGDVTGQLGSRYMADYFNPYEQQVVQGTLGDIERSRQMQDIADRARAIQSRAFGGSRQAVQSALTNEAALRQAATTASGLRQAGFSQAAQLGQSDAARQLQAQMANQGVALTLEQANAQLRQQAALANQQAGISGAGLRQAAIGQYGQLGAQQQNLGLSGISAIMNAQLQRQQLEQQRLDAMRNLPLERLAVTGGALGLQPANTGGTQTQPLYSSPLGSALGGALSGAYIGSLLKG